MANLEILDSKGKKVGTHELSAKISKEIASSVSLHRAVIAEDAAGRQGTQSAKTRSEVRGGGRKPYKQKKTGNARQGSNRSPHYAHGSMALAVKPRNYDKKINKKERRAAILSAFAHRVDGGDVIVLNEVSFKAPKTKEAAGLLKALDLSNTRRVLVIVPAYDEAVLKSFRNLPGVVVRTAPSKDAGAKTDVFSARDLLLAHKIVLAKDALGKIEEVWA